MSQPDQDTSVTHIDLETTTVSQTITLTPADQLAFWVALHAPVILTPAQEELGRLMRGEPDTSATAHES